MKVVLIVLVLFAVSGCQAFLPAISFSCRHGEYGPSSSLEAAKINEELIHNLSALCAKETE